MPTYVANIDDAKAKIRTHHGQSSMLLQTHTVADAAQTNSAAAYTFFQVFIPLTSQRKSGTAQSLSKLQPSSTQAQTLNVQCQGLHLERTAQNPLPQSNLYPSCFTSFNSFRNLWTLRLQLRFDFSSSWIRLMAASIAS